MVNCANLHIRRLFNQDRKFEEMYYQELIAKEQAAQRDASPRKGPRDGSPRRGEEDQGSYMDQFQKNRNKKVRVEVIKVSTFEAKSRNRHKRSTKPLTFNGQ